ncbi:lipase family protein [Geobacter argillaceus]|uniref:Uncharacterized protein n=1 Tax=Geobacter argillaceus TaxID=345631 RepID=A0A562V8T8_9BACT|nr:hypothetical protein [Geobacter argillaceus]TWJ14293.1 hypothetical protein JN12_03466 [Geobacter argillaceus]
MGEEQRKRKIIVGVHGIGDQVRNETIQMIARQFCKYYQAPGAVPLGRYHSAFSRHAASGAPPIFFTAHPPDPQLPADLGFREVYWADIPRGVVKDGYTLEETVSWAKTIVERLQTNYPHDAASNPVGIKVEDARQIKRVLEEIIETVTVLERLLFIAEKAGLFSFDLSKVLTDFVGDVQLFTEFETYREQILGRFFDAVRDIHAFDEDTEIHVIAHSEGTVVSFLALLEGLGHKNAQNNNPDWDRDWGWIDRVRSFITIGSPIDKHLILWPELWERFTPQQFAPLRAGRVTWLNYYDFGDPVGFELNSARSWLDERQCRVFAFDEKNDIGFSRYLFPGKAHVDYWDDDGLFRHCISTAITPPPSINGKPLPAKASKPTSSPWARFVQYTVSTICVIALFLAAAFLLGRIVNGLLGCTDSALSLGRASQTVGYFSLLAGVSMAVRIQRLTRIAAWQAAGIAVGILGIFSYLALKDLLPAAHQATAFISAPVWWGAGTLLLSTVAGRIWPDTKLLPLLLTGGGGIAILLGVALLAGTSHGSLWMFLVNGAAFLYLWWLAILVFDLVFIWHRYIRLSMAGKRLHQAYIAQGCLPRSSTVRA